MNHPHKHWELELDSFREYLNNNPYNIPFHYFAYLIREDYAWLRRSFPGIVVVSDEPETVPAATQLANNRFSMKGVIDNYIFHFNVGEPVKGILMNAATLEVLPYHDYFVKPEHVKLFREDRTMWQVTRSYKTHISITKLPEFFAEMVFSLVPSGLNADASPPKIIYKPTPYILSRKGTR